MENTVFQIGFMANDSMYRIALEESNKILNVDDLMKDFSIGDKITKFKGVEELNKYLTSTDFLKLKDVISEISDNIEVHSIDYQKMEIPLNEIKIGSFDLKEHDNIKVKHIQFKNDFIVTNITSTDKFEEITRYTGDRAYCYKQLPQRRYNVAHDFMWNIINNKNISLIFNKDISLNDAYQENHRLNGWNITKTMNLNEYPNHDIYSYDEFMEIIKSKEYEKFLEETSYELELK